MTTYKDLQDDIADSIDDTTGEYSAQIRKAILKAIRFCERDTYYFNETQDQTFSTVSAQQWYDSADNANIPTLVNAQELFIDDGSTSETMPRYQPQDIEELTDNGGPTGRPYAYTYFGQRIRLFPVPDAVYTIRMQLGPYRLTALASDSDTNAWLAEAYDMVFERAKYHLAADTLKDAELAIASLNLYREQQAILKAESSERNGTGDIRPTQF